ncbi:hypothetical protein RB195_004786 [Necator americanus]|uniref:Uncharacterized protein n=1 Tax=Necator americanus TaxID=51031 RepID=A0ABR1BP15_NECAM
MVLFCDASSEDLKAIYMALKGGERRRLCDMHFIETGQRLTAKITSSGGILSRSEDGSYYIRSNDIPPQLLTNLRAVLSGFDDSFRFTEADIVTFVTDCLYRHYNGEVWRGPDLKFPETVQPTEVEVEEEPGTSGFQFVASFAPSTSKKPKLELESAKEQQSISKCSYAHSVSSGSATIMVKRRTCCVCRQFVEDAYSRWASTCHKQRAVLLCGLVVFVCGNLKTLKVAYELMNSKRKRICDLHFIETGRCMTDQIILSGGSLLRSDEQGEVRAYIRNSDIPQHLVESLQNVLNRFDDGIFFSVCDVGTFVNECLWRYHNAEQWMDLNMQYSKRLESQRVKQTVRIGGSHDLLPASAQCIPESPKLELKTVEKQESTDGSSNGHSFSSRFVTVGPLRTPKEEPSDPTIDTSWKISELPPQDPSLLKNCFMVEGKQLIQLFRFCPQCGSKIPPGNKVRLLENGTTPIVQHLCSMCSLRGEPVKRWVGQKHLQDEL